MLINIVRLCYLSFNNFAKISDTFGINRLAYVVEYFRAKILFYEMFFLQRLVLIWPNFWDKVQFVFWYLLQLNKLGIKSIMHWTSNKKTVQAHLLSSFSTSLVVIWSHDGYAHIWFSRCLDVFFFYTNQLHLK